MLEVHVITLNPGIKSHEPHTHAVPEIVLMVENESEMEIGDGFYHGTQVKSLQFISRHSGVTNRHFGSLILKQQPAIGPGFH